ncbi:hypothetical protein FQN60_017858, partial [Etheostoma spectabile]
VDLGRLIFLTVVGTQGRYARYSGNEFARAYRLNYSRDGLLWKSWRNRLGNTVMEGNKNAYTSVINDLHPPIITRYVRLIPVTKLSTTVCMRVELYGCPWEGRTHKHTHTVTLTDGVIGLDDFLVTRQNHVWPGYNYLGWRNDSLGSQGYVEMEFVFDRQRNFTSMK